MSDYLNTDPAELDRPGLDWLATRILLDLEMLSDVGAASLGQHVKAGKPGHKILSMVAEAPHLMFGRRYIGCHTDESRRAVIRDGIAEIKAARYSRSPTLDLQTLDGQRQVGRDTRPAWIVAYEYGVDQRTVYRWRAAAKKYDEKWGRHAA